MIKIKLCTSDEYFDATMMCHQKRCEYIQQYSNVEFEYLAYDRISDKWPYPPFRDEYSLRLLKESYGVEFVKDDWYSAIVDGNRMCIYEINESMKFGLVAIKNSLEGRYTGYSVNSRCLSISEEVYEVLNNMPFDILVAVNMDTLSGHCELFGILEVLFQDYPFGNERIDVYRLGTSELLKDKKLVKDDKGRSLYLGEDGKYYIEFGAEYDLRYDWRRDIQSVIKYIEQNKKNVGYFYKHNQMCNINEFVRLMNHDDGRFEGYDIQIINHMIDKPDDIYSRKLPMLIVEKRKDCTYKIYQGLTYKYPDIVDILYILTERRSKDYELSGVVVDADEVIRNPDYFQETVCGFKVSFDSIEVFDKYDGLNMFREILLEALDSEKCEIKYD